MLAKLCGVDFNPTAFANNQLAQTRVCGTSAIVIRHDARQTQCYNLLGDQSYAVYIWECLQDAMAEFGGIKLGIAAYTIYSLNQ